VSTVSVQILDLLTWFVKHSEGQLLLFVPKQFHIQEGEKILFFDKHLFVNKTYLVIIHKHTVTSELEAIVTCDTICFQLEFIEPTYDF
jgi:hypothetical protein